MHPCSIKLLKHVDPLRRKRQALDPTTRTREAGTREMPRQRRGVNTPGLLSASLSLQPAQTRKAYVGQKCGDEPRRLVYYGENRNPRVGERQRSPWTSAVQRLDRRKCIPGGITPGWGRGRKKQNWLITWRDDSCGWLLSSLGRIRNSCKGIKAVCVRARVWYLRLGNHKSKIGMPHLETRSCKKKLEEEETTGFFHKPFTTLAYSFKT